MLGVQLTMRVRKWCVIATAHTALHSRLASCCCSGLRPKVAQSSRLRTWHKEMPNTCKCTPGLRVLKEPCEHVASVVEDQLHVQISCRLMYLFQVAWSAQVDPNLNGGALGGAQQPVSRLCRVK